MQDFFDDGDAGTAPSWNTIPGGRDDTINCFTGHCQVIDARGHGPGDPAIAVANDDIDVVVRLFNTSRESLQLWSPGLAGSNGGFWGSNVNVNSGGWHDFHITLRAPPSVQNYSVNFTPRYFGDLGPSCNMTIPVYQEFNIDPRASIVNTNPENPTTVTYTSGGNLVFGPSVTVNTHSWLTKQPPGGPPDTPTVDDHNTTDTYGNLDHTYTYANPVINAGDRFCAHTTIDPATGFHGPSGNVFTTAVTDHSACLTTVNEPYTHFQGSDVMAGGGFGDNCTTDTEGGIYAYIDTPGARPEGSGAQFGAQALGVIQGLSSANLRSGAPTGLTGLTFSNSVNVSGVPPGAPNTGGRFGLASNCVPDYYSKKPNTVTNTDPLNIIASVGTAGAQYYKPNGGTLFLGGGTLGTGVDQAIYVEGNVRVTGNITYGGSRTVPTDVPSLYIIVKGGNIFIDPNVTQLDGVFIAQPDGSTGGKITTCANGTGFFGINSVYDQCKRQLVINGAFVAQQIFLDRAHSSLRYAQSGENVNSGAHGCGILGKDIPPAGPATRPDCAAEVFNFTPEIYLSQPASNPVGGPATGRYDYITNLSPVL